MKSTFISTDVFHDNIIIPFHYIWLYNRTCLEEYQSGSNSWKEHFCVANLCNISEIYVTLVIIVVNRINYTK